MAYVFGAKIIVVFYVKTEINFSCPFLMVVFSNIKSMKSYYDKVAYFFSIALSLGIPDTY